MPAQHGSWVIVGGPARGAQPVFLLDAASGRFERSGGQWKYPVLSPDGTRAVRFEASGRSGSVDVVTLDLNGPTLRRVRTAVSLPTAPSNAVLSRDGSRLAVFQDRLLSIYDLASGASLGAIGVSGYRGFFMEPDRFRVLQLDEGGTSSLDRTLTILEFDLASKRLTITGVIGGLRAGVMFSASSPGDRLLVRETEQGGSPFTTDIAGAWWRLFEKDRPWSRARRGFSRRPRRPRPGRRCARRTPGLRCRREAHENARPARQGQVVSGRRDCARTDRRGRRRSKGRGSREPKDLSCGSKRGEHERRTDRLDPVISRVFAEPNYLPVPESEAAKLFYGPGGSLVHLDILTGERRTILAGHTPLH